MCIHMRGWQHQLLIDVPITELQAEHPHAAGLINFLFKGHNLLFTAALLHKQVVNYNLYTL